MFNYGRYKIPVYISSILKCLVQREYGGSMKHFRYFLEYSYLKKEYIFMCLSLIWLDFLYHLRLFPWTSCCHHTSELHSPFSPCICFLPHQPQVHTPVIFQSNLKKKKKSHLCPTTTRVLPSLRWKQYLHSPNSYCIMSEHVSVKLCTFH